MTQEELIKGCKARDRRAQKALYDQYAPILFAICRRYVKHTEDAEDVLLESLYKIMSRINRYNGKGSFEGWMKRITINEALMFLRKKHNFHLNVEAVAYQLSDPSPDAIDGLFEQDLLDTLDALPVGYRTIFNLYVIEGYKHREIAQKLDISINTSKSQLIQAKRKLAELIKKNQVANTG